MDRYIEFFGGNSAPDPRDGAGSGFPRSGSVANGERASRMGAWWFHMVTEELRNVIIAGGIDPDSNSLTQLRDAIRALIEDSSGVSSASELVAGVVRIATSEEAELGESDVLVITPVTLHEVVTSALAAADLPRANFCFNGYGAVGVIAPLKESGISSITKESTGVYICTLSSEMADAHYEIQVGVGDSSLNAYMASVIPLSTTQFKVIVTGGSNTRHDADYIAGRVYGALKP